MFVFVCVCLCVCVWVGGWYFFFPSDIICFSLSLREAFTPFLERSFKAVFKMINSPSGCVREAAVLALCQFCISFSDIRTPEGRAGKWLN
jgi:hypothetical protein